MQGKLKRNRKENKIIATAINVAITRERERAIENKREQRATKKGIRNRNSEWEQRVIGCDMRERYAQHNEQ